MFSHAFPSGPFFTAEEEESESLKRQGLLKRQLRRALNLRRNELGFALDVRRHSAVDVGD
jgi:hypothetical protein